MDLHHVIWMLPPPNTPHLVNCNLAKLKHQKQREPVKDAIQNHLFQSISCHNRVTVNPRIAYNSVSAVVLVHFQHRSDFGQMVTALQIKGQLWQESLPAQSL